MIGIILALALCAGFAVPALAAETSAFEHSLLHGGATAGFVNVTNLVGEEQPSPGLNMPNLFEGAANWAIPELEAAYDNNLILNDMFWNWSQPTNRLVAAEAIVRLIENLMHTDISFIAEQNEYDLTDSFIDTTSVHANFLKQSGISNGVDGIRYDPEGTYTRAQMVTMLGRTAKHLFGVDTESFPKGSALFSDVPDWADEFVGWAGAVGITDGVGGGRFDSNGTLQNNHTGVFSYRAFSHFGKLRNELFRTCQLLRTGEYLTEEQMEIHKAGAKSWQSAIAGIGDFADFVVLEPADGSMQQVYMAFRIFDQDRGEHIIHDNGYEKMQIVTPHGAQARIFYVSVGAGSGEIYLGYKLETEDAKWVENFYAYTFDFEYDGQWENTTEYLHQLFLKKFPPYMKQFDLIY